MTECVRAGLALEVINILDNELLLFLSWCGMHVFVFTYLCRAFAAPVSDFSQLFNLTPPIMLYHTHTILTFSPCPLRMEKATHNSFNGSEPLMCISWPTDYILCEFGNFRVTVLNDLWRVTTRNTVELFQ